MNKTEETSSEESDNKNWIEEDLKAIKKWTIETISNDIRNVAIWDKRANKYWKAERAIIAVANWLKDGGTLEDLYDNLKSKDMSLCVRPDYFPKPTPIDEIKENILTSDDIKVHMKMYEWEDKQTSEGKKYCIRCWMENDTWSDISVRRNASFCETHQTEHRKRYLDLKKEELPSSARAKSTYYGFAKICEVASPEEIKTLMNKRNREQERLQKQYGEIREQMKSGKPFDSSKKKEIEERIRELRTEIKIASQIRIDIMRKRGAPI
jgi:hypothetical protein